MSNRREQLTVNIQGRDFSFKCPEDSREDLQRASEQLDAILDNLRGGNRLGTLEQAAILAGINLIDQINQSAKRHSGANAAEDNIDQTHEGDEVAALKEMTAPLKLKQQIASLRAHQKQVLAQLDNTNKQLDALLSVVNSLTVDSMSS